MPQFSDYQAIPYKKEYGEGIPAAPKINIPSNSTPPGGSVLGSLFEKAINDLPTYAKPLSVKATTPILTQLDKTLRYTDPELGFNPLDYNLEYRYADAKPWSTLGNNLLQGTARFLGSAVESIATIPIAINAAVNKDFSKMHNNVFTNSITDWLDGLQTALPTYKTEYEESHPLLKYLGVGGYKSALGAWGGAFNNLGYTAGAIAGALAQDAAITALTGGFGTAPLLAVQVQKFGRLFTNAGKLAAATPKAAQNLVRVAYPQGVQLTRAASFADEAAVSATGISMSAEAGTGLYQSAGRVNQLVSGTNKYGVALNLADDVYKIRDAVKYNLALLTSAAAEGSFEAADVRKRTEQELSARYKEVYGTTPYGEELRQIKSQSNTAADVTLGANIALLYLSNRVNWGNLFKPTNQAMTEGITGWGKNIARTGTKMEWQTVKNELGENIGTKLVHNVYNKTPEGAIAKILLNGEKALKIGAKSINEGIEEAAQFTVSEAALDYTKHKYDPYNIKQVGDFMKSFNDGLGKTFGTNEGWDNIIGGIIGGMIGGGVMGRVQKQDPLNKQLENQSILLNSVSFNDVISSKIEENATAVGLAKRHTDATVKGDVYTAKNLKFDMLYNWVSSGLKAGNYEKRMEELRMAEDLRGESFQSYWGVEDTEQNRQAVSNYIVGVKQKAENIKNNYEKVGRLTKNPHKRLSEDWRAFETYKDELALNLSRYNEYQRRMKTVKEDLTKASPLLDIETAIEMTSVQGIEKILQSVQSTSNDLVLQMSQAQGNQELVDDLTIKKNALDSITERLLPMVDSAKTDKGSSRVKSINFEGTEYLQAMKDLYSLLDGVDMLNNVYIERKKKEANGEVSFIEPGDIFNDNIEDDQFADILQRLQDIYKLGESSYGIGKYYTYLRKGLGQTEYMKRIKEIIQAAARHVDENNDVKTKEDIEDNIRQEEYEDLDPGETTTEERQTLKEAAKKTVFNEPLTKEETEVVEKHKDVFDNYEQAERRTQNRVVDEILNTTKKAENPEDTVTENNKKFVSTTPESLFFALHRNEKFLQRVIENIHNIIFNIPKNKIGDSFVARIAKRPEAERKITPVNTEGKLQRKDFDDVIQIFDGDKIIGELRPPESLYMDENGNQPLFSAEGKLLLTEDNYSEFTGNSKNTFAEFKTGAEAYYQAYQTLYKEAEKGDVSADFIKSLFKFGLNPGSTMYNSKKYKDSDTLLKDTAVKNKAVMNIVKQADGTYQAVLLKSFGLTQSEIEKAQEYVRQNQQFFINNGLANKMVAVFPVAGEVLPQSFIRARFVSGKTEKFVNNDNVKVATLPQVFENFTINFIPKGMQAELAALEGKSAAEPIIEEKEIATPTLISPVIQAGLDMISKAQETLNAEATRFKDYVPAVQKYLDTKKQQLEDPKLTVEQREKIAKSVEMDMKIPIVSLNNLKLRFVRDNRNKVIDFSNENDRNSSEFAKWFQQDGEMNHEANPTYTLNRNEKVSAPGSSHEYNIYSKNSIEPIEGLNLREAEVLRIVLTNSTNSKFYVDAADEKLGQGLLMGVLKHYFIEKAAGRMQRDLWDYLQDPRKEMREEIEAMGTKPKEEQVEVEKPITQPTYVQNKTQLAKLLQTVFGYNKTQAEASAELFDAQANAWAARNPGKTAADYYKEIRFGTKQMFEEIYGNDNDTTFVQFSKAEQTKIQKEVEALKSKGTTYPAGKTNLNEQDWFVTQTPTFKAWFNNGTIVDENGDPLVQYHYSPSEFEVFDLNRTSMPNSNGMGAHFGTKIAAEDRKMFGYQMAIEQSPIAKQIADHVEIINNSNYTEQDKKRIIGEIESYIDNLDGQPLTYSALVSYLRTTQFLENDNTQVRQATFELFEKIGEDNNIAMPKGSIYSVFLNSKNLLNIPDEGEHYLESYKRQGVIEESFIRAGVSSPTLKQEIDALKTAEDLNNLLNKYGFDGIVYENVAEDAGTDSYLITQRNRIKSVDSAAFSNESDNMYYQESAEEKQVSIDDINECF